MSFALCLFASEADLAIPGGPAPFPQQLMLDAQTFGLLGLATMMGSLFLLPITTLLVLSWATTLNDARMEAGETKGKLLVRGCLPPFVPVLAVLASGAFLHDLIVRQLCVQAFLAGSLLLGVTQTWMWRRYLAPVFWASVCGFYFTGMASLIVYFNDRATW